MDLESLLRDQLGNREVLSSLGDSIGADSKQVAKATELGLPALLEGLTRNSRSQEGAESLASALEQHQDAPVADVKSYINQVDTEDGKKILGHVFLNNEERVEKNIAQASGLSSQQTSDLLSRLAPLILGALGQQKKERDLDAGGIKDLLPSLSSIFGGSKKGSNIGAVLDVDDGVLDDITDWLGFGKD